MFIIAIALTRNTQKKESLYRFWHTWDFLFFFAWTHMGLGHWEHGTRALYCTESYHPVRDPWLHCQAWWDFIGHDPCSSPLLVDPRKQAWTWVPSHGRELITISSYVENSCLVDLKIKGKCIARVTWDIVILTEWSLFVISSYYFPWYCRYRCSEFFAITLVIFILLVSPLFCFKGFLDRLHPLVRVWITHSVGWS